MTRPLCSRRRVARGDIVIHSRVVLWVTRPSAILFQALEVPSWYVSTPSVSARPVACTRMSQCYRFESGRLSRRGATPICGISHCHNQPAMAGPLYHHSSPTNVLIHRYSVFPQSAVFPAVSYPVGRAVFPAVNFKPCFNRPSLTWVVPHGRCDLPAMISWLHRAVAYNLQPELHWSRCTGRAFTERPIYVGGGMYADNRWSDQWVSNPQPLTWRDSALSC